METAEDRRHGSCGRLGVILRILIIGLLLASCAHQTSTDAIVIDGDNGGRIGDYLNKISDAKRRGTNVRITGNCLSACTLWTSMSPDKICVGDKAVLGFHQPYRSDGQETPIPAVASMSGVLISHYPDAVKDWLNEQGGLEPQMKYLSGPRLREMFKECKT